MKQPIKTIENKEDGTHVDIYEFDGKFNAVFKDTDSGSTIGAVVKISTIEKAEAWAADVL